MGDLNDEDIVKAVQDGDIDAFGVLVERYEAKLTRYARKFLFDGEDCKDLVQDVFLKAYQNIRDVDTDRKFSSWVYRIAHNEYVNALKKKSKAPLNFFNPDLIFPHPIAPETADRAAIDNELRSLMDGHLNGLDSKYREPLILYFYEELNYKEIADVLQIPVATVGVRLQRGKTLLRSKINQEEL